MPLMGFCLLCLQFVSSLKDNLNAEVVLGSVTNVRESSIWLGYTYLFVRMTSNPLVYGMTWEEVRYFLCTMTLFWATYQWAKNYIPSSWASVGAVLVTSCVI